MGGNVNFTNYNQNLVTGDHNDYAGNVAARVENHYRANTAGFGKRFVLGILTLGIYAIVQHVRDNHYEHDLKHINAGTKNFYNALNKVYGSDFDVEGEQVVLGEKEKVTLSNQSGRIYYQFEGGERHEIKDPKKALASIENDVMRHSEFFDKDLVLGILKTRREAVEQGPQHRPFLGSKMLRLQEQGQALQEENEKLDTDSPSQMIGHMRKVQKAETALEEVRKPVLTENKERLDTMLAELFTSRLKLNPSELEYIDRDLGLKLAEETIKGNMHSAEDVRAFINRNASSQHFTTIESARLLRQFEDASRVSHNEIVRKNLADPASVKLQEGYYQPKENPALPAGKDKAVHDFVAQIVCDDNPAEYIHAPADHFDSARLRRLFSANKDLIGELMANLRDVRDGKPGVKSMLETVEPDLRKPLEDNLWKLEEKWEADVQAEKDEIAKLKNQPGWDNTDFIRKHEKVLNFLTEEKDGQCIGRSNFIGQMLHDQSGQEYLRQVESPSKDVDDLYGGDLDALGGDNWRENYMKRTGAPEKEVPQFPSTLVEDPEENEKMRWGLDFFGQLEKDIDKGIADASEKVQQQVSQMLKDVFPQGRAGHKSTVEEIQAATDFKGIIGTQADDPDMQLIKAALEKYFAKMPVMDQRSMIAAQTRFCTAGSSKGARFGALLKGAGPVMQKMLQGLDASMFQDEDFKLALSDMKDKLAPISPAVIKGYLFDAVKQSEGAIKGIEVVKALGAASVAQTLLCTVTRSDGTKQSCVIKVLRPDATMRAQREKAVFDEAAQDVGLGMPETFNGRFKSIMEELDLRLEARNVAKGNEVYDYEKPNYTKPKVRDSYGSFSNVHSEKLFEGIAPSVNLLALEQAPGDTLENYLADTGTQSQQIAREAREQISKTEPGDTQSQAQIAADGAGKLTALYNDCKAKLEALTNLSYMWANEGLFASGFYHGDVHKGNIMVPKAGKGTEEFNGVTMIDFGNATQLDAASRKAVINMMTGTAAGDYKVFDRGFRAMLSPASLQKYDDAGEELKAKLTAILHLKGLNETAERLTAMLKLMQREYQIEVPGPVHNFLESEKRLQVCMDQTQATLKAIAHEREALMAGHLEHLPDERKAPLNAQIKAAADYRPQTMMDAVTDVVKQNIKATIKSLGIKDSRRCWQAIEGQLAENAAPQNAPQQANPAEVPVPELNPNNVNIPA